MLRTRTRTRTRTLSLTLTLPISLTVTQVTVRNLLGRAERVDLKMEVGQQKSTAFILSAAKPRWLGTDTELTARVTKESLSHLKHSSTLTLNLTLTLALTLALALTLTLTRRASRTSSTRQP